MNDGSANLTCSDLFTASADHEKGVAGDLDGDGDIDIIFGVFGASNRRCLNDGSANFSCANIASSGSSQASSALLDIENDGDLDVIFAHNGATSKICTNNGSGTFSCSNFSGVGNVIDVNVADYINDGFDDIMFAAFNFSGGDEIPVCLNNQAGGFNCSDISSDKFLWHYDLEPGDIDNDGDVDIVFGDGVGPINKCLNDGTGSFTCSDFDSASYGVERGTLMDLNNDGILDFATGDYNQAERVWFGN